MKSEEEQRNWLVDKAEEWRLEDEENRISLTLLMNSKVNEMSGYVGAFTFEDMVQLLYYYMELNGLFAEAAIEIYYEGKQNDIQS